MIILFGNMSSVYLKQIIYGSVESLFERKGKEMRGADIRIKSKYKALGNIKYPVQQMKG